VLGGVMAYPARCATRDPGAPPENDAVIESLASR
jgi:hypothetical protein